MVSPLILCNDKWWMPSHAHLLALVLKRPFQRKLINNKMSLISAELVMGFWWSWTVIGGNLQPNQVSVWWESKESAVIKWKIHTHIRRHAYTHAHAHTQREREGPSCCFQCFLLSSTAYQLRTCQPPPPVANATILTDDDEFEIGLSYLILYVYMPGTMRNKINPAADSYKVIISKCEKT